MEAHTDDEILVVFFNSNTAMVQIKTLCDLDQMLSEFYYDSHNEVVLLGTLIYFLPQI